MAINTIVLPITKSGYVRELEPTVVLPTDAESEYKITRDFVGSTGYKNGLCFGFGALPERLKYARIYEIAITLNLKSNPDGVIATTSPIEDFDPETLTYANRQQTIVTSSPLFGGLTTAYANITSRFSDVPTVSEKSDLSVTFLRKSAFIVQNIAADKTKAVYAKIELTSDASPYITVTYDDTATVSDAIAITKPIGGSYPGSFNASAPNTIEWDLIRNSEDQYYCYAESFEQASAVFYWRKQGESAWNQIPVTGSDKRLVIPKDTFTTDPETPYEYYVSATDVLGNVLTSGISTCLAIQNLIRTRYGDGLSPFFYYYNPHKPLTFYWEVFSVTGSGTTSEEMEEPGSPGDVTILWRSGLDGEIQSLYVPVFGASEYTFPADTFPAVPLILYRTTGTDSTGYQCLDNSVWLRFETAAGPITSVAVAPINSVVKNNQGITFLWQFNSDDGNPPGRFELLWRLYGASSWNTLVSSSEIATEYTVPAGTFPVGQIEWAVIPYNIDGIEGNYTVNSFIAYGAPEAPLVSATAVPFTTITWQSEGQQAYEIEIDGTVYGVYFGADKSFSPPDRLADGEHTIRVRVAGTYYLWSEWSTTTIQVENETEYGVYLSGEESVDVGLSWETDADSGDFYVYRDGILVARTTDYSFSDRLASGAHSYQVLNRLPDGNYCISQELRFQTVIDGTFITAADDPAAGWLHLQYTTEQERVLQLAVSAVSSFAHYAGDVYPKGFTSGYRDTQLTLSAAFRTDQTEAIADFESLIGKAVIVKHDAAPVFVGVLNSWNKSIPRRLWVNYVCGVQQIEWEDFVDGTQ